LRCIKINEGEIEKYLLIKIMLATPI
jgi:hypothetical protein